MATVATISIEGPVVVLPLKDYEREDSFFIIQRLCALPRL